MNARDPLGMYECSTEGNEKTCEGTQDEVGEMKEEMEGYKITSATDGFNIDSELFTSGPATDITDEEAANVDGDPVEGWESGFYGNDFNCSFIQVCYSRLEEIEDSLKSGRLKKLDGAGGGTSRDKIWKALKRGLPSTVDILTSQGKWMACTAFNNCGKPPHKIWPRRELVDKLNEMAPKP